MKYAKILFIIMEMMALLSFANAQTDIAKIDKNFKESVVEGRGIVYVDALKEPFKVEGFAWRKAGEPLVRVSKNLNVKNTSGGVMGLAKHTSGGSVRFKTNSGSIALRFKLRNTTDMSHMARSGACGFDVFLNVESGRDTHLKTICPTHEDISKLEVKEVKVADFGDRKMREYTIWLPLYGGVETLEVGVEASADILKPSLHAVKKPVLFYGSSITQGGCASRAGNNYSTMLCRAVDAEQINLGFSGNAKGEIAIAKDIAGLDLAAFVYDYDYNAPTVEHLANTHEKFFLEIRKSRPNLPIIMLSRCSHIEKARRDVVEKTYKNAVAAGDKNVWFIDGAELFGDVGQNYATVDDCHPTDLGFYQMFKRVLPVLKEALKN